jgi:hypothetical protein
MAKGKIRSAGGVGDSKIFCAAEDERSFSAEDRIKSCHINGILIAELQLGPEVIAALDYYATDEGQAEKNSRPDVRERSGVSLGADPFDKSLQEKRDDVIDRGYDSYEARDPLREVADQYAVPGMRPKFMSAAKIKDGGNRDYVVVKDAAGDPVKVRGMILGHIPERLARSRNRHYQERGNAQLKQLNEKYKEEGGATAVSDQ